MLKGPKLSHHNNSGRLRPHEHTSYLPLCILLLAVGGILTSFTAYASTHPDPQAGSVALTGSVPGKAPSIGATIKSPTDGQHFSVSPVSVSGSCTSGILVEVFKNDIFAGSTTCTEAGVYSLDVDLLIGKNLLISRVYDALNQPGPDSNAVTVFYDALPPQTSSLASFNFSGGQLVLNTDAVFRGVFPGQELNIPIDILGGSAPYAVNIQWGDTTNKVIPRNDNIGFTAGHSYTKPGTYQITLQATDAGGHVGFLTVAAIVNGQPAVVAATTGSIDEGTAAKLLTLWPLYVATFAILGSFWLGERREKRILSRIPIYK